MEHASDVTPLDFRHVLDALEEAIEHGDGSLTIYGEHGVPVLVLKDASVTETGAIGWVD
jgi:hypothetical protein